MNISNVSVKNLRRAITLKEKIENLKSKLAAIFGDNGSGSVQSPKGKRSPAVRARMAAAQRARWAKLKGERAGGKPKRKMSAAGRAKIAAAARARWAKAKAAGKNSL